MLTREKLQDIIIQNIADLISVEVAEVDLSATLDQVGLDSLSLARLFIELEQLTGVDPLRDGRISLSNVNKIAEIIAVYGEGQEIVSPQTR